MSLTKLSVENQVAMLTIDNPPVNSLSSAVLEELIQHLTYIEKEKDIRVVLVTGAGEKAFMAGADIKEFASCIESGKSEAISTFTNLSQEMFNSLANLSKPTIAVINGLALGGGCELALACDFRIALSDVRIGLPEIGLGLLPGGGGTQRLPRLIGVSKAKEMIFLGEAITAQEAITIGLINEIAMKGELFATAMTFADKLKEKSGSTLKIIKNVINEGIEAPIDKAISLEAQSFEEVFATKDAQEGVKAFVEKRKPQFTH